ncbi:MAG: phosphatase PAP2 family protein [Chitinophagales bacterium]|nr:phosphatase PAP2 family protein [Chitinophagales bacterium]MDW8273351.1 phosphatase PAP2 family protein [Chitinophagales bacterium]
MNNRGQLYLFFPLTCAAAIAGLILHVTLPKGFEILYFNHHHNIFSDYIFIFFTRLAEMPLIALPVLLLLRFKGITAALEAVVALTITSIIVQILKKAIFEEAIRPHLFFAYTQTLRLINDMPPLFRHSFPSGHTAGIFCLMTTLSLKASRKESAFIFFIFSVLTALSRIYLLQHFLIDVVAGSMLGMCIAMFTNYLFSNIKIIKKLERPAQEPA